MKLTLASSTDFFVAHSAQLGMYTTGRLLAKHIRKVVKQIADLPIPFGPENKTP